MAKEDLPAIVRPKTAVRTTEDGANSPSKDVGPRRSFLKGLGVAGVALSAGSLLTRGAEAEEDRGHITSYFPSQK